MGLHILNGWKEISSYIERAARTAQRWELQFGMPVHRPANNRRTAVVAFADELDVWLIRNAEALNGESHRASDETDRVRLQETLFRLQFETKELTAKLLHLEHIHDTANSNGKGSP
jgi:hypothetical protein